MQELTFETILRLPQMELKKRLKAELKSRGYPVTDKPGYLYAEGTIPVLLVAHMDTVHRQPVEQVCYSADGAVAMSPQGIGGDDPMRGLDDFTDPAYNKMSCAVL